MKISKTLFKQYTRCPRVCALDDIYKKKLGTDASIFGDDEKDNIVELLHSMFDSDTGDDLVNIPDAQMQALLPYYNKLEEHAMAVASEYFGGNIHYSLETKKQKSFQFIDNHHNEYYCYLDGFQETDTEIRIFEVKATTTKKFRELGPTVKGSLVPIFIEENNILKINPYQDIDNPSYNRHYQKLFNRYSDVGRYVFDLAVERYIIENAIKQSQQYQNKKLKYYLVVLNNNYVLDANIDIDNPVYRPDRNNNELVSFIDLSDITLQYQETINTYKDMLTKYLDKLSADPVNVGRFCERKSMAKCPFVRTCWKAALEPGSILEYIGGHHGFKDETGYKHEIIDLVNSNYLKIDSIPRDWLSRENNIIQRYCYDNNAEYLNKEKIIKGIKAIKYPIYHLDFESFPSPLPRYFGESPYTQSVFQYSLHVEKKMGECDKHRDHFEFLARDNEDHRLELVQKLIKDINLDNGGTVLVYNKSFEQSRIKELADIFPQYRKELEKINRHIFDLMDIVSTRSEFYIELGFSEKEAKTINYYHNKLRGSFSIKKVLPLFSDLSYEGMGVANGTEAIAAYASFKYLDKADLELLYQDMIEYCKQDTWAMVVILLGLAKKVGLI